MARIRTLKPGFFTNEVLAEIDPLGRLLFQALWCLADREGRLEDRPKRIKIEALPYDACDVDGLLAELAARGFIWRYRVAGAAYIQVVNFAKHQTPHTREAVSTCPAPPDDMAEHNLGDALSLPRQCPAPPDPDPDPCMGSSSGIQESANAHAPARETATPPDAAEQETTPARPAPKPPTYSAHFEQFWHAYPRKEAKGKAWEAWGKHAGKGKPDPDTTLLEAIFAGLHCWLKSRQWATDRVYPHASTWLNQRRWEDEPEPAALNGHARASPPAGGRGTLSTILSGLAAHGDDYAKRHAQTDPHPAQRSAGDPARRDEHGGGRISDADGGSVHDLAQPGARRGDRPRAIEYLPPGA